MGNQQGAGLGQLIPHKSLMSTQVVKVWRLPHPHPHPANSSSEAGEAEAEEGQEEVVVMLRCVRSI